MKQNIFFLILDSLRADKFHGNDKSSITPHMDALKEKGVYFEQCICAADQTGTSLASLFTSMFPCKTKYNEFNFSKDTKTYFSKLKEEGYNLYSFLPNIGFFENLTPNFDKNIFYSFQDKDSWLKLEGGLGKQIMEMQSNLTAPWFFLVHLMDIRPPFEASSEFQQEEYGKSNYDKLVSSIDPWIGEIIEKIDFTKTIFILTSDHGEYIPVTGEFITKAPKIQKIITKSTKHIPFLKKIGTKAIINVRFAAQTYQKEKLKHSLSPFELRSLNSRVTLDLYDELVRVPLLIVTNNIQQNIVIKNLVRHIDIMPTILDILNIQKANVHVQGRSLIPLIENKKFEELSAYIEVGINLGQLLDSKKKVALPKVIGIRTSEYKYYRSRLEPTKLVKLFDLKNDPFEKNNLAEDKPELVNKIENQLQDIMKDSSKESKTELTDDEIEKAKDLLLKLGYI